MRPGHLAQARCVGGRSGRRSARNSSNSGPATCPFGYQPVPSAVHSLLRVWVGTISNQQVGRSKFKQTPTKDGTIWNIVSDDPRWHSRCAAPWPTYAHFDSLPSLPPHPILWPHIYPVTPAVITLGSSPPAPRTSLLPFVMLSPTPASHIRSRPRETHIAAASVALERRDQRIARPP